MSWNVGIIKKRLNFDSTILLQDHTKAWYNCGTILGQLGMYDEAIEKLKEAVRLNPNYADAWNNWGMVLKEMGKEEEAKQKFLKAKELRLNATGRT